MADAAFAGLPRLVRSSDELRWRGGAAIALAVAVAAYWTLDWLLDQPVEAGRTGLSFAVALIGATTVASVNSGRRLREGLAATLPPPRLSVYETRADARERRVRLTGIVVTGALVLLVFDRVTGGGGGMAGLLAGLFAGVGGVDRLEARRWAQAARARRAQLYLMVRPPAMVASFGLTQVYEASRGDDIEPVGRAGGLGIPRDREG